MYFIFRTFKYTTDALFSLFYIFEIKILTIIIHEKTYTRFLYLNITEPTIESITSMVCIL